ncbi:acetylornithine deacetylase [Dasania sp. GY-MA-18]|uniref:Acetylornithine deacetylase n=1 Tax=Dasania phycosphaerae TaxID=2950436 RepID=A0A9J6RM93_9GAMM|nr:MULTISPECIES: acetylornithine deacetylase [Dasania]MCR8923156.1 acetylornithine deacetylase [Dasania sp. GY-MA-18]MCZ0865588.1 acetylornithine deacetylase [Dasania phycosphaerae]MCZ0869313.1 acetylornithine deacetylase [Dasania phycosphaerae]
MADIASIELIEKLIQFDTTSYKSNLELIEFVRDYLLSFGVESQLVYNPEQSKANLYATIGPQDKPGVMLSGHTDVVPVTGQNWHTDPFTVVEKDGLLYGRGTADMKSFIAIALAFVPEMQRANLTTPIHLAFSFDEEIGCVGVRHLLTMMEDMPLRPAMCIVGEPTSMQVVNAHKGKLAHRVTVNGLEAHSSLPHIGVNAVDYAAELVVFIRRLAQDLAEQGPFEEGFEVTYTTLHTGKIAGGTALNIVPKQCTFDFEIRNIPGQDPQPLFERIQQFAITELEPQMKKLDASCGFEFEQLSGYPGMFTPADAEVVNFVQSLSDVQGLKKITFGTEGGLFTQRLGIPTVVCGPGNIEQAHKPNEFIAVDQVAAMNAFMRRLIAALS